MDFRLNEKQLEELAAAYKKDTDAKLKLGKWLGVGWGDRWDQCRLLASYIARRPYSLWEDRIRRALEADTAAIRDAMEDCHRLSYFIGQTTNCYELMKEWYNGIQKGIY